LRDFRTGEVKPIDPALLDFLHDLIRLPIAQDQRPTRQQKWGCCQEKPSYEGDGN
jgi:hypothetical protein